MADFTVSDVLAWARTKPASAEYNFLCNDNCAICQFLRDTGRATRPFVDPVHWKDDRGNRHPYPAEINAAANAGLTKWDFGGLVKRLEALCPETPVTRPDWLSIDAYLSDIEQAVSA